MSEKDRKPPHIYHEIAEIQKYSKIRFPANRFVKLLGVYKGAANEHFLHTYQEYKGQDIMKIPLNMSLVQFYPRHESIIEIYGSLDRETAPAVNAFFWSEIVDKHEQICSYLECLRLQKSLTL